MPLISVIAGAAVLWATWFFYQDDWNSTSFPWFRWIQPLLMVIAGLLCFIAATLFVVRKPSSGWELLKTAVYMIPVILAIRLVIVIIIFIGFVGRKLGDNAGRIMDGTLFDGINLSSRSIVIQAVIIVVVVVVVVCFLLNIAKKAKKTSKENKDE